MRTIRLEKKVNCDEREGTFPDASDYDLIIQEPSRIYKPDGSLLLVYLPASIEETLARLSFKVLLNAKLSSRNRGTSTQKGAQRSGNKLNSGKLSKTNQLAAPVYSGLIGHYDRYTRTPFCRQCRWNRENPGRYEKAVIPLVETVDGLFKEHAPDRYEVQRAIAAQTHPEWMIGNSAFTTITVNTNYQTAIHKDAGDLAEGFGVMACLRSGSYTGNYLVMPEYRVAVDLQHRDLILFDVHSWHGNTDKVSGFGRRITCVFYYRRNMIRCGSATEELERVKNRQTGTALWTDDEVRKGDAIIGAAISSADTATPSSSRT